MIKISIGLHDFLSLIFMGKDISSSLPSFKRLDEGIEGHKYLQLSRPPEYEKEVSIEFFYTKEDYEITVRGRIDGIYRYSDIWVIEEIKTTYISLESLTCDFHPYYLAQLRLYMYFISSLYPEKKISGLLTYFSLKTSLSKEFKIEFNKEEIKSFFEDIAEKLIDIDKKEREWISLRDFSLLEIDFPFCNFRDGQEELIKTVSNVIEQKKSILIQAATGIGKTSAVLFPSIKNLYENNYYSKIFFLTAKTSGQAIVRETIKLLQMKGLHLRSVFINAKEKMCFCDECNCDPSFCHYAEGYYERISSAIEEILPLEIFTSEEIIEKAKKYVICPFEFSLDLSIYSDLIVCDYNYVFDPRVFLKRFFLSGKKEKYLFLVDEAHNLVSRGREMYSSSIKKKDILNLKRKLKGKNKVLYDFFDTFNKEFIKWEKSLKEDRNSFILLDEIPEFFKNLEEEFFEVSEEFLRSEMIAELRDFYYEFRHFCRIKRLLSDDFRSFIKREDRSLLWKFFCVNPGGELSKRFSKSVTNILFSATLSPSEYFIENFGLKEDTEFLKINSPFPPKNALYLHVPNISTTYREREGFYGIIAEHIKRIISIKPGKYLCFFPSYNFLQEVFVRLSLPSDVDVFIQKRGMAEEERGEFLSNFTSSYKTMIGMVVMGGIFGEAIDLPGEKLIGAIIVGVGLPMVDEERYFIQSYFDGKEEGKGFLYSYMIPGIIRVIQSAGRVFRTPEDKGIVVLMDNRFRYKNYLNLLPKDWFENKRALSTGHYEDVLSKFWEMD